MRLVFLVLLVSSSLVYAPGLMAAGQKRCMLVTSYHKGYEWEDGIVRGVEATLKGKCKLKIFRMDTKSNNSERWGKRRALLARTAILKYRPDVVIAADDNVSRYLVVPYYRNASLPFVFCGINWTVREYGYPFSNATGMIEVAPLRTMLKRMKRVLPNAKRGVFLSSNTRTEHKDFERYRKVYEENGIKLDAIFVSSMASWKDAFLRAQNSDFVIVANNAGIRDWNHDQAVRYVHTHSRRFSVTYYRWMLPYASFGLTKKPEEQGIWSAKVALAILGGTRPADIPIVVNRHWDMWINRKVLERLRIKLPMNIVYRSRVWE